jgi:molybdopterin converting factor small subunit
MVDRVTILLFATARVAVGAPQLDWPVESGGVTARALVRSLGQSYPKLVPTLRMSRFVLNGRYLSSLAARVRAGDEFAVHPPYGGG